MGVISDHDIERALAPYGVSCNSEFCRKIRTYISLLLRWNRRISLTAVTDPAEILRFHFGESLFALSAVPLRDGRLADLGSGAGFPGLPLRMARPGLDLLLIESNGKKATFLAEVVRELDLSRVEVFRDRMESISKDGPAFDFVTARAVGCHDDLLTWACAHATGGKLVLWLGEEDASRISNTSGWKWELPVQIPGSKRRFLLVGSPEA
jgi:16S rRNA (guanine527-N7)-methyltransferase